MHGTPMMLDFETLPTWANLLCILVTFVVMGKGAHFVVESATMMANRLGISEVIIGLTVVAFGTSAPEFAVTLIAAFQGHGNISVGNIVGSNTFNLGFILGGCALLGIVPTDKVLVRRDGLVLAVAAVGLLGLVGWDAHLGRLDGAILFLLLVAYLAYLFKHRKEDGSGQEVRELVSGRKARTSLWREALLLAMGLAFVVGGSHVLLASASALARSHGISEWTIAVTIVAAGTSAPEFATSLVGVLKGRYGISLGNLIGSDIFNLLGVLGLAGMLQPVDVTPMARISLTAMCGMVFWVLISMRTGWRISRLEGAMLIGLAALRWWLDFATRAAG